MQNLHKFNSFYDVIDRMFEILKLPAEYREPLNKALIDPDVGAELAEWMSKPKISFADMPPRIKKIFKEQSSHFKKIVANDINRRLGHELTEQSAVELCTDDDSLLSSLLDTKIPFLRSAFYRCMLNINRVRKNPDAPHKNSTSSK